jgi:mono/diheme cytochrome c family protein
MKKLLLIAALSCIVYACSQKITSPAKKQEKGYAYKQDASIDPVSKGRYVYQSRCGECHGLKNITDYSNQRWVEILREMIPKAKLTTTEKEELTTYPG